MTEIEEKVKCNFCGGERTIKGSFVGKDKKQQRYYCRDCQRFFRENAVYRKRKKSYAPKFDVLPDERRLIAELRQIAQMLGKTPTINDIRQLSKQKKCHTLENYYAVFDSFVNAVRAAELKQHYKQEFDKETLLSQLRELGKTLDRPVFPVMLLKPEEKIWFRRRNIFKKRSAQSQMQLKKRESTKNIRLMIKAIFREIKESICPEQGSIHVKS